jgi:hypothetical protein
MNLSYIAYRGGIPTATEQLVEEDQIHAIVEEVKMCTI